MIFDLGFYSSEITTPNEEIFYVNSEKTNQENLKFNIQKAKDYLYTLYDYLESLGGDQIYAILKKKSPEENQFIIERIEKLLEPITKYIGPTSQIGGGLYSIGLGGLYTSVKQLLETLSFLNDPNLITLKIFSFFLSLGCTEQIYREFQ